MKIIITKLTNAKELIQNRKYSEALQLLQSIDSSQLKSDVYGTYCLLRAEASLYLCNYSCENYIDNAIEIYRSTAKTKEFAQAKFLKGWYFIAKSKYSEAREILLEAYTNYLRCRDKSEAARTLNQLSFVALQLGSLESAISNLKKCANIYSQCSNKSAELSVLLNLSYLYFMNGLLKESINQYDKIYPAIKSNGDKDILLYYIMSAIPHALKGDIKIARKIIAKAELYLDKYIREKAIYYENLGLINILDGKYDDAETALQAGLEISLDIAPQSALISQIKRLMGDLYLAKKQYRLAEKFAKEALQVAEKINERVEIAACWRVLAEVELYNGNVDKTREWYSKAIDLFRLIDARYELAVTQYRYAMSGVLDTNERTALLYMAQKYFTSEDVSPYVEKVRDALRTIPLHHPYFRAPQPDSPPAIITADNKMKEILSLVERVAPTDMSVLLTGETGTGKDLLAQYIHYHSGRKGKFVPVNAAAIPDDMVEAELFGHSANAFTGAKTKRVGLFEEADGGTFYLNEAADASPAMQAKLLEVLENRQIRRLGENTIRQVNFRLIAATNHDLMKLIEEKRFRADLYHRLSEAPFHLPPLRDRVADIPLLVAHFLTFAGFDLMNGNKAEIEQMGKLLQLRYWQGNVRELRAEIRRLWTYCKGDGKKMLRVVEEQTRHHERERLLLALIANDWNQAKTAQQLGISDGTIRSRMRKYGLKKP